MLEISTHQVAQVALMAHELRRAEPEFRGFVNAMNCDAQAELVAVLWVGRGIYEPEDFEEAVETARAEASTPCADYLIGTPHMAEHLENGLDALGYSVMDAEGAVM
ncbi:MAG: DUF3775 domain-containing protein [Arenibacterium sp.]